MTEPVLLTESYDIQLGGGSWYEAYYDCGFGAPVQIVVAQSNHNGSGSYSGRRGSKPAPQDRVYRWFGESRLLTPAWLGGQTRDRQALTQLAKSDMSVRALKSDPGDDDVLAACRDDAQLLAERSALILGAVKTDKKGR